MGEGALVIEEISLDGYEVVSGESMSLSGQPLVTFDGLVVSFNSAALKILPDAESVLFMIKKQDQSLCVRPCRNGEKAAFRFSSYNGKRQARKGTCKKFILRLMRFMSWNFDFKYKLLGSVVQNNGTKLVKFDLTAAEKIPRKNTEDERFAHVKAEEWNGTFGVSLARHEKAVTMPTFLEDTTIIIDGDNDEEA